MPIVRRDWGVTTIEGYEDCFRVVMAACYYWLEQNINVFEEDIVVGCLKALKPHATLTWLDFLCDNDIDHENVRLTFKHSQSLLEHYRQMDGMNRVSKAYKEIIDDLEDALTTRKYKI